MATKTPPKKSPTKKTASSATTETRLLRELAKILNETDLSEIEMEKGTLRLRVARQANVVQAAAAPIMAAPAAAAPAPSSPAPESPSPATPADASAHPGAVKSPMVGTAYIRPSPDADQFVKVGDSVKEGETVLLVEAMKTFNPIVAPKSGKIGEILVEDAQPVEFGEALFIIV